MMRRRSLTVRLLQSLVLPITLTVTIVVAYGYWSANAEIDQVYDSQLVSSANVMWLLNRDDEDIDPTIADPEEEIEKRSINLGAVDANMLNKYTQWRFFRVWKKGALVLHSNNAPPESFPPVPRGFSNFTVGDHKWRGFALYVPKENTIVEVAELSTARGELITNIALGLLWPLVLTVPIIGLLIWRALRSGLLDLRRFAEALTSRSSDDMSELDATEVPVEILPLAQSLNQLLDKLKDSLAHERTFMDNAAHELRTPLAALSIQVDVARAAKTDASQHAALDDLAAGVARAAKLVDQMLILGRSRHQLKPLAPHKLYPLVREIIKDYVPLALRKNIDLSLSGDEQLIGITETDMLTIMLGNVIDNAIKYTPEGGQVAVEIHRHDGRAEIRVTDSGPGIPTAERENVFARFYRLHDQTKVGSGLGLAIVKHIAELLQAELTLGTGIDGKGLQISLRFAAA